MTNLNQQILNLVRESEGHLTAEQAFLLAKNKGINVSMASIYRILGKLADDGLINRIHVANKPDIFDKTISEHEHMICSRCGKVKDIHINDFKKILIEQTGINDIDSFSLCIDYICEDCKNLGNKG